MLQATNAENTNHSAFGRILKLGVWIEVQVTVVKKMSGVKEKMSFELLSGKAPNKFLL